MLQHGDRLTLANINELVQALKDHGLTKTALTLLYSKRLVGRGLSLYASPGTTAAIALNHLIAAQADTETSEL